MKLVLLTTISQSFHWFQGLAGYLDARGIQVYCMAAPGQDMAKLAQTEPVEVRPVPMTRRISPFHDLLVVFRLVNVFREIRPSIVHAHTPKAGLLGMASAWLARVPNRVYHIHGLPSVTERGLKRWVLRASEMLSCSFAHRVICVSRSLKELVIEEGLCSRNKIRVLHYGSIKGADAVDYFNSERLTPAIRESVRKTYDIPTDALVVGFAGRIAHDKGFRELVKAWDILKEQYSDLHLFVVGEFDQRDPVGPDVEYVLRHDRRIHLTKQRVSNMPAMYAAMDVVVLPSYREGFGLSLIEAGAMQLPVVGTEVPGCVDAVMNNESGLLVPPYDVEALVTAIRRYVDSPELRVEHGKVGRQRVLRCFEPEAIWEALWQEYESLLRR